jgi:hypothetical protein
MRRTYEEHSHDSMTHEHDHYHITHNKREGADAAIGEWEHLTAQHTHAHNHPGMVHSHEPHATPSTNISARLMYMTTSTPHVPSVN